MLALALLYGHETEGAQEATHQWYEICVAEGAQKQSRRPVEGRRGPMQHAASVRWSVTGRRASKREIAVTGLGMRVLEGRG